MEPRKEIRRLSNGELRLSSKGKRKLVGYAARFNSLSDDLGGFREQIAPGAFKNALKKSDVRALLNHESSVVLGRVSAGTLRLKEDSLGLFMEVDLPNTQAARDLIESIERGDITQQSFGFRVAPGGDSWSENKAGEQIRTLLEIDELFDVSPVTFPAYPETSIEARHKKGNITMKDSNLRDQWGRVFEEATEIMDTARSAGRGLTQGERDAFTAKMSQFDELAMVLGHPETTYRRLGSLDAIEERLRRSKNTDEYKHEDGTESRRTASDEGRGFNFRANPEAQSKRHSFNRYLLRGREVLTPEEYRGLMAGSDIAGGYLVAPQQFVQTLIQAVTDEVYIRKLATIFPLESAESLGAPSLESDFDDCEWTTELGTGSEDDLEFGKRELRPHPIAKRVKVSNKLLRGAAMNPEDIVRMQLERKFASTLEKGYMTGTGHNQPLGVFTASDEGISTARDVSTGNTETQISFDGLIEAQGSLKAAYQKRAVWIFHRDAITQIRRLKDGEGAHIWAPASASTPETILGRPYFVSEYCPNTFTSGKYVGIIGDFSFYWIADSMQMGIQKLVELYAETNQTGYIGRFESDGMPVLAEAFARVTLA